MSPVIPSTNISHSISHSLPISRSAQPTSMQSLGLRDGRPAKPSPRRTCCLSMDAVRGRGCTASSIQTFLTALSRGDHTDGTITALRADLKTMIAYSCKSLGRGRGTRAPGGPVGNSRAMGVAIRVVGTICIITVDWVAAGHDSARVQVNGWVFKCSLVL